MYRFNILSIITPIQCSVATLQRMVKENFILSDTIKTNKTGYSGIVYTLPVIAFR